LFAQALLSRLIEMKYSTELYLSNVLKKEVPKATNAQWTARDSSLGVYNTMRWKIDGLVYSLSGDMIASNSPRKMRLLNEWCLLQSNNQSQQSKIPPAIEPYVLSIQEIEALYQQYIVRPEASQQSKTLNLTTNVFYLLKDSYTIVKGLSDMKTQKTMALIELLDHARLLSPNELGKGVK
jgi:hypothetical protein